MQTYQDQKFLLLNLLKMTADIANTQGRKELGEDLAEESRHLNLGELYVVVCGECKRGKSSLINAFLDEPDLCPPAAPVATNAVTIIRFAETEKIVVHMTDEKGQPVSETIARAQIRQYVTEQGNARNTRRVRLLEAHINNPKLKDGLILLDTPGVGSLNIEHTEATYRFIPYADAVIFAGSATEPLTMPELEFAKRIVKHTDHLLHVLTKRDLSANYEEMMASNVEKLAATLDRPAASIRAVAVSSIRKKEYATDCDPDTLELSGFTELERELWGLLKGRGAILLSRGLNRGLSGIAQMKYPLETEYKGLLATSEQELKDLDDSIQEKLKRAEELSSESSFWVNDLRRRMDNLISESSQHLTDQFIEIRNSLTKYLKVDDYVKNPEKLGEMLTTDTNNSLSAVLKSIATEMAAITDEARSKTALLGIEVSTAEIHLNSSLQLAGVDHKSESRMEKTVMVGRITAMNTMGMATISGIAGGVIGAIAGSVVPGLGTAAGFGVGSILGAKVGGIVGTVFGIKKGISEMAEKDLAGLRQNLEKVCRDQLFNAERTIGFELNRVLRNATSDIQMSMLREIQHDQKACKEAAAAILQVRQEKKTESSQRKLQLGNSLKQLENIEIKMRSLGEGEAAASGAAL